ncbi:hypothetical protein L7F22_019071 [Adiantum nelumboides]|nr:hypothetical protein [Adiantum nelumboides]
MHQVLLSSFKDFDGFPNPSGGNDGDRDGGPRLPPNMHYEGPWLQQQLILSASIGILSFLIFSLIRRRSPALFAPRTKLKGFAAHAKGIDDGVFSWILPTLKTDEIKILHVVGLDAAILLNFFKMGFWTFLFLSLWSCCVLIPVNYHDHGSMEGVAPGEEPQPEKPGNFTELNSLPGDPSLPWLWRLPQLSLYHSTHLLSTYIFTALILRSIYKGYNKFVRSRQLYALDLLQSIPARTVEVRNLPDHLRKERDLAEYFETMGYAVESTVVVREVRGLKDMLTRRANALYQLEKTWCDWLGNPTTAESYDPDQVCKLSQDRAHALAEGGERMVFAAYGGNVSGTDDERARLLGTSDQLPDPAAGITAPKNKPRPMMHVQSWNPFSRKVDAITLLETRFRVYDESVKRLRSKGSKPSFVGFVTFVDAMSAQVVVQSVHYPIPGFCKTNLAPEPRDIVWSNVSVPSNERRVRQLLVSAFTIALFIFYIPPLTFLASLLSPNTIKKYLPSLYDLLRKNRRLEALVSTNLPSVVLIGFNALLPLILEWTAYLQGIKARSLIEMSVLKRYHLFLLISVIFIFLITSTALGVLTDLAGNPMRIIDKLAQSLPQARHFSLSYVVFQSLAIIPLQLLQLPVTFGRAFGRLTAKTPRQHAELNAPPQLYSGSVYPAALIVFTLGVLYSIVTPLITVFAMIYFALAYLVYKYKLLFVFYRSYESRGQAWPLSSMRCLWALLLFQIFQLSLFSVRKQLLLSTLTLPLIAFTFWFHHYLNRTFTELSEYVSLSSIAEINKPSLQPGTGKAQATLAPSAEIANAVANNGSTTNQNMKKQLVDQQRNPIVALRAEALDGIDPSETVLSRKRYSTKDETLFIAQKDRHTDYREPPAGGYYYGILNTGRRRYGHPAVAGILPDVWPPVRVEDDDEKEDNYQNLSNDQDPSQPDSAAAALPGDNSDRGSLTGGGGGGSVLGRTRRQSRPHEAVVVSLRKRRSSLIHSPSLSNVSGRNRKISSQEAGGGGSGISGLPSSTNTSTDLAGKSTVSFPQQRQQRQHPQEILDESCEEPEHQHEDPNQVWGTTSRSRLPSTAEQIEDDQDETQRIDESQQDLDIENDDDEDDESEETAGVYMHRNVRQTMPPGSFPGFED